MFDLDLVREINRLWLPVYAGIARQVADHCSVHPAQILEIGSFSGGTGIELLRLFPKAVLTVVLEEQALAETFFEDWAEALRGIDPQRIRTAGASLVPLDLPDNTYDIVFCRGVFFFLDTAGSVLREACRVLAPGGFAFLGGGFGAHTPDALRAALADESRVKNNALGRKMYSHDEFRAAITNAGLDRHTTLITEGGLWALIQKGKNKN
jgi:SAM-dependent methyltransferase